MWNFANIPSDSWGRATKRKFKRCSSPIPIISKSSRVRRPLSPRLKTSSATCQRARNTLISSSIPFLIGTAALAAVIDLVRDYPQKDTWFLGLLFVAPARRNMGFGSRLLDAIYGHVKQRGGHAIRLGVVRGNVRARTLYDRTGFRVVDECKRTQANGFTVIIDVLERAL